jgi:hypothetical protein
VPGLAVDTPVAFPVPTDGIDKAVKKVGAVNTCDAVPVKLTPLLSFKAQNTSTAPQNRAVPANVMFRLVQE